MNQKGFTLIELLVVVAIVGVLAAVGAIAFQGFLKNSKATAAKTNCNQINNFLEIEIAACNSGMRSNFLDYPIPAPNPYNGAQDITHCPLNSPLNKYTGGDSRYPGSYVSSNAQDAIESWKYAPNFNFKNPYQPEVTAISNSANYELDMFIGYCQITTFGPKKLLSQICWDYPCSDSNNRSQKIINVE